MDYNPRMTNEFLVIAAFVIDAFVGEFRRVPHPVQGFGLIIGLFDRLFNGEGVPRALRMMGGAFMAVVVAGAGYAVPYYVIYAANVHLPGWACSALTLLLAYTTLSVKGLADAAKAVSGPLGSGDIEAARKSLSMVVGRDTSGLDEAGVARAAIETVAENSSDGLVAPLFFMAIGGVPLAMAYKAVNTMDSMVGYMDDRYRDFGRVPARLDDVANFIPARITALYMVAAAWLLSVFMRNRYSWRGALNILFRDRLNHKSPNSGHPESAMAGALGLRLGGPSVYFGRTVDKPYIGDDDAEAAPSRVGDAVRLLYVTGAIAAADLAFFAYFIRFIGGL